jgi:HK97 family phage portal protein
MILDPITRPVKALTSMVFNRTGMQSWFFMSRQDMKYMRKVGNGDSSSVVVAPLLWIGRNFPEAPPALWLKSTSSGEEQRVVGKGDQGGEHPMLELMERPNDFYTGSILWMATIIDYHISGNGYWLILRDQGARPSALWWAPSGFMTPQGDEKTYITTYKYQPYGAAQPVLIDPTDVVHFRYSLDPNDPRKGRSPLSALLQEVFTDQEASEFTAALLSNMGVPGVVVAPKGDSTPTKEDVDATKTYFKEAFSGSKRGEPLVMSGATSVNQFGFSPQQLSLRDLRRVPEERVTAALGVPAIVAGLGAGLERSTFANFAEAREAAYQDCLIPAQRLISEDIKYQLLPNFQPEDFRAYRFGFDLSGVRVLQEDRGRLVERLNVGVQGGWVRVAEARRSEELEVDSSDEVYLRQTSTIEVPVGEVRQAPVPASNSPGQEPAQPPTEANGSGNPQKYPGDMTLMTTENGWLPQAVRRPKPKKTGK